MNIVTLKLFAVIATLLLLVGCATSSNPYTTSSLNQVGQTWFGVVHSVNDVRIKSSDPIVGPVTGAVVLGVLGNQASSGPVRAVSTILGAMWGWVIGNSVEHNVTRSIGQEITVIVQNKAFTVVQTGEHFDVGDRIKVTLIHGKARISKIL